MEPGPWSRRALERESVDGEESWASGAGNPGTLACTPRRRGKGRTHPLGPGCPLMAGGAGGSLPGRGGGEVVAVQRCCSDNDEMLGCGPWSRRQRNGAIESDKPSSMLHGEREKIDIGHLAWPVNVAGMYAAVFEKTDGARPELVVLGAGRPAQPLDGFGGRNRVRVPGLADDADESVLRQGAGGPAVMDLAGDPLLGSPVVDVVCVQ